MDKIEKLHIEATKLLENDVDRITINKILEVIEKAYSLGLFHGTQNVFNDYD